MNIIYIEFRKKIFAKSNKSINGQTLCIAKKNVAAHIAHGDKLGTCGTVICDGSGANISAEINEEIDETDVISVQVTPMLAHQQVTLKLQHMTKVLHNSNLWIQLAN